MAADEAIARQLAQEESHASQREYNNLAYQPRQPRQSRQQQQQQQAYSSYEGRTSNDPVSSSSAATEDRPRDELDQVVDTFKNAAESAKKMGANLFTKLSTKIKELDQPRTPSEDSAATTNSSSGTSTNQSIFAKTAGAAGGFFARTPAAGAFGPTTTTNSYSTVTPAAQTQATPRTAPSLPHGNRYARPSAGLSLRLLIVTITERLT